MTNKQSILLTGATGFVGRYLFRALRQSGHEVQLIARSPGHDYQALCSADNWLPHLQGVDAVINAVGIINETSGQGFDRIHHLAPAALFDACSRLEVKRVVQLSALGADERAFSAYHLSKRAADNHLRSLPLDWFVLRPSIIYGEGSRSLQFFRRLAALPMIPLIEGGTQPIQPVHIDDVVECVQHCLDSEKTRLTLDLVGPDTIGFADWLNDLRQQQGKRPARIVSVPKTVAYAGANWIRHFIPFAHPDNLRMLQQGNTADPQPFNDFLGRELSKVVSSL